MARTVFDPDRPDLAGNNRHGHVHSFCPRLWRYVVEQFAIRSVLDVGCGEGHAVQFFQRIGVLAHGIDGSILNVRNAVTPIAQHDVLAAPYIMPVDMVWSCEVAEHIEEARVDNYLRTLANGRLIAMTHGVPGQPGHHHVNCQPAEYWVEKLATYGYVLDDLYEVYTTISGRDETFNYFCKSGLIFHRM